MKGARVSKAEAYGSEAAVGLNRIIRNGDVAHMITQYGRDRNVLDAQLLRSVLDPAEQLGQHPFELLAINPETHLPVEVYTGGFLGGTFGRPWGHIFSGPTMSGLASSDEVKSEESRFVAMAKEKIEEKRHQAKALAFEFVDKLREVGETEISFNFGVSLILSAGAEITFDLDRVAELKKKEDEKESKAKRGPANV